MCAYRRLSHARHRYRRRTDVIILFILVFVLYTVVERLRGATEAKGDCTAIRANVFNVVVVVVIEVQQ